MKFIFATSKKCIDNAFHCDIINNMESWKATGEPDYVITSLLHYEKIWQPCVYIWTRQDVRLYVGKSRHGTQRIQGHHIIKDNWQRGDEILFFFFDKFNRREILCYERGFINKLKPIYNKVIPLWNIPV